jgi:peptide/nickel transport system ATP-binding protein
MNEIILRTESLKAFYILDVYGTQKIVKAVNDVTLDIRENEVYGIAGESGCGKTTLLRALAAAIEPPLRLVDGYIFYYVNGKAVDIATLRPEAKRKLRLDYIAYVPQGSMSSLNPVIKLKETYRDFIESHVTGKSRNETLAIAEEHIVELGLPPKILNTYPHQLSGGMRQRVTIALAALLKPSIIIADEPTTALDVVVQRGVVQLLQDIQKKLKNTIIMVTHDMGVQANIADRVGIMYAGRIVEESTTEKIYGDPQHPYTQFLINSLPKFGDKSRRESVPGSPPSLIDLPEGCPFHPRCPHAMGVCSEQIPELIKIDTDHRVACWLLGGEYGKAS